MVLWLRIFTSLAIISSFSVSLTLCVFLETNDRSRILITSNETDRTSLLAFKAEITHDPLDILSSWNHTIHFCKWYGVTCGKRHQRVTKLVLYSTQLAGALSPHTGNLSFLRILELSNNSFAGTIPQQLGQLFRLRVLGLTNNTLSGGVPVSLSHCLHLVAIYVDGNRLQGMIPEYLGSLSRLREIFFTHNKISGMLPSSLGNLSSLEYLAVDYNNIRGVIPESFGQMKRLKYLYLRGNKLTGYIPFSLYNISSLRILDIKLNQLEGTLPPQFGLLLPNIEDVNVAVNRFKGRIPFTITNASKLSTLELEQNAFFGEVPPLIGLEELRRVNLHHNSLGYGEDGDLDFLSGLANDSNMEVLELGFNNFGGIIPRYVSNFSTRLTWLSFQENKIWGSIPSGIGNLIGLNALNLGSNRLTGSIPKSTCALKKLSWFYLYLNKLSGKIPSCIGNLTSLLQVDLGSNNLQGEIPASLGNCKGLIVLVLSENMLNSDLPRELTSISSLIALNCSDNQLTGSMPTEVGNLVQLGYLNLENNRLSSEIPGSLGDCISLEELYLGGNFLHGTIPQALSSLRGIQYLDFSNNNLSGRIPEFLGDLKLVYLNLSFNNLEGAVPIKGIFKDVSAIFLSGNHKLCGGLPRLHLPQCFMKDSKGKRNLRLKMILSMSLGTCLVIVIVCLIVLRRLKKAKSKPSTTLPCVPGSILQVSYATLLKATGGFSLDNLIGRGSFGSVYKGILENHAQVEETDEPSRQIVAVKVLDLDCLGASKSFIAECEALRNIKHRNLVKILTACSSTDFRGNNFKALVYEFMENGSLEGWLHPSRIHDEPRTFSFLQRLNVSIDVASALDYLHHYCETPIVHCDLKPSNILLDGEMTAHLGDFGLARLLHGGGNPAGNGSSSIGIRGTIGYAPPEYGMGGEVSTYGDTYSYGILLLEIFTGKRPTDNMFREGHNLHDFVKASLPEGLTKIVDHALLPEQGSGQTNQEIEVLVQCLSSIFEIGLKCSARFVKDRMDMTDVVAQLNSIRTKFLRGST